MADESAVEEEFTTHTVREFRGVQVRGGYIVNLLTRTVRDDTGATINAVQEDVVCPDITAAASEVSSFLSK